MSWISVIIFDSRLMCFRNLVHFVRTLLNETKTSISTALIDSWMFLEITQLTSTFTRYFLQAKTAVGSKASRRRWAHQCLTLESSFGAPRRSSIASRTSTRSARLSLRPQRRLPQPQTPSQQPHAPCRWQRSTPSTLKKACQYRNSLELSSPRCHLRRLHWTRLQER